MTDDPAATFGQWLSRRMDDSRPPIDNAELGRRAGIAPSTVGRIRRGESRATPDTLRAMAPVLGVDYVDLMTLAGYGRPAGTLTSVIGQPGPRHPLAVELDRMLADDSPITPDRRRRLEALIDAVMDPERKTMRRRRTS